MELLDSEEIMEDLLNILCANTRIQFNNVFKFKNIKELIECFHVTSRLPCWCP